MQAHTCIYVYAAVSGHFFKTVLSLCCLAKAAFLNQRSARELSTTKKLFEGLFSQLSQEWYTARTIPDAQKRS